MKDEDIIALYFERNENAITESAEKFGRYCTKIAENILSDLSDSEECVNDTWMRAWNMIPPEKPQRLSAFFGKITRNLAIDIYRKRKTVRNGNGQLAICLDELSECVGDSVNLVDGLELKETMDGFLNSLKSETRKVFMLRYWYMYPITDIAKICNMSEGAVKMSLKRTRESLEKHLKKEGVKI